MFISTILAVTLLQSTEIPLQGPAELGLYRNSTVAGQSLFIGHPDEITVRSLITHDLQQRFPLAGVNGGRLAASEDENHIFVQSFLNSFAIEGFRVQPFMTLPVMNTPWNAVYTSDLFTNPNGDRLVVIGSNRIGAPDEAAVFETQTGVLLRRIQLSPTDLVHRTADCLLSRDGQNLVYVDRSRSPNWVRTFDMNSGNLIAEKELPGVVPHQSLGQTLSRLSRLRADADSTRCAIRTEDAAGPTFTVSNWTIPLLAPVSTTTFSSDEQFEAWDVDSTGARIIGVSSLGVEGIEVSTGLRTLLAAGATGVFDVRATSEGVAVLAGTGDSYIVDGTTGVLGLVFEYSHGNFTSSHRRASNPLSPYIALPLNDHEYSVLPTNGTLADHRIKRHPGTPTDADRPFHLAYAAGTGQLVVASEPAGNIRVLVDGVETGIVAGLDRLGQVVTIADRWAVASSEHARSIELIDLSSLTSVDRAEFSGAPVEMDVDGDMLRVRTEGSLSYLSGFDTSGGSLALVHVIQLPGDRGTNAKSFMHETVVLDT